MSRGSNADAGLRETVATLEERIDAIATAIMGTEEFARTANVAANLQLRMQKGMAGHMSRQLALFNMPSREDITALAERVMTIDERLVRVEELLVEIARAQVGDDAVRAPAAPRPARTRKPARKAAPPAGRKSASKPSGKAGATSVSKAPSKAAKPSADKSGAKART